LSWVKGGVTTNDKKTPIDENNLFQFYLRKVKKQRQKSIASFYTLFSSSN
jgi:hypothetical protein